SSAARVQPAQAQLRAVREPGSARALARDPTVGQRSGASRVRVRGLSRAGPAGGARAFRPDRSHPPPPRAVSAGPVFQRPVLARGAVLVAGLILIAGCAAGRAPSVIEPATALRPVGRIPILHDDADPASLRAAVAESLAWLATQPGDQVFVAGPRRVTVAEQTRALRDLLAFLADGPSAERLAAYVRETFDVLEAPGGPDGRMLVTCDYAPVIAADERPSAEYSVPVLSLPDDLVEARLEAWDPRFRGERVFGRIEGRRLVPYWRRADIDAGRLSGRG